MTKFSRLLHEAITNHAPFTQADAARAAYDLIDAIKTELAKGERVSLPGFGSFTLSERPAQPARNGRNPATGAPIEIPAKPAHTVIKFKPASAG